jgi:hypothetical protein
MRMQIHKRPLRDGFLCRYVPLQNKRHSLEFDSFFCRTINLAIHTLLLLKSLVEMELKSMEHHRQTGGVSMFKKASKVFVLTMMIAVLVPSYTVMGMEHEAKQPKVFVPKEMASEDELLEEDFTSKDELPEVVFTSERELFEEESQGNEVCPVIVLLKLSSYDKCNWLSTTVGGVIDITGPYGVFVGPAISIVAPVACSKIFGPKS